MNPLRWLEKLTCGCLLSVLLFLLLLIAAVSLLWVERAQAQSLEPAVAGSLQPPGYEIVLVADQSLSMWDCDGVGSDPEQLRVEAVQLFVNYLGADSNSERFRLGLIHFGGAPVMMAPLTDLGSDAMRAQLLAVSSDPAPISWTDQLAALRQAQVMLATSAPDSRRVIVLLTDGEPAWPDEQTPDPAVYKQELRELAAQLQAAGTDLFIVQLTNPNTACNQRVIAEWMDVWHELAAATRNGEVYTAVKAGDLLPIYHAIVRDLIVRDTGAMAESSTLLDAAPLTLQEPLLVSVPVHTPLTSMTLIVLKQQAATNVEVLGPLGEPLAVNAAGLMVTGQGSRQEVWRFENPATGLWRVRLNGEGQVTVWQDRIRPEPIALPTVTATLPAPTPEPTATSTAIPSPTATNTPEPTATSTATPLPTAAREPTAALEPTTALEPMATMTPVPVIASAPDPAPGAPWWSWLLGGFAVVAGAGSLRVRSRRSRQVSGELEVIAAPADAPPFLPTDLAERRGAQFAMGRRGQGQWRLHGWDGNIVLKADKEGKTVLVPSLAAGAGPATRVTLNGVPVYDAAVLEDGAVIGAGEYRIRYRNLLQ